jgi:hypothetical protein
MTFASSLPPSKGIISFQMSSLSSNAIQYTINQFLTIIGINKPERQEFSQNEVGIKSISLLWGLKAVVFRLMPDHDLQDLIAGNLNYQLIPTFDSKFYIPIFLISGKKDFITRDNNTLEINADILTISFLMLSRYEEVLLKNRDKHLRFQSRDSIACKYKFLDLPIVDEYALLIRNALVGFMPGLEIRRSRGKIIPTYDIDDLQRFGSIIRNIQTIIGGDIFNRRNLPLAINSFCQSIRTFYNRKNDPNILAITQLLKVSQKSEMSSIFFFKAVKKGQQGFSYDIISKEARYCIDLIKDSGMTIGLHGSYYSFNNSDTLNREKELLESIYCKPIISGRQHYLRFEIRDTIRVWQRCFLEQDSTLGYSDVFGFRCGTCHEYNLYDFENDTTSSVKELPMILMDLTIMREMKENPRVGLGIFEKLYKRCLDVEGNFVFIWHNENVYRDNDSIFKSVFKEFMHRNS